MTPGSRVVFFAAWSTWRGMHGRVVDRSPGLWVLIDGDKHPVAVSSAEVIPEEAATEPMTAGG